MRVDVWEVVEAAATKPFGFMSFKPGPGLGGHCLPVDPFYLAWKAREFDFYTEFIELAGKVNENMPYFCLEKITRALNSHEKSVKGSRVHLVGVSYKADVGDLRESPALKLIELLRDEGADVSYHDPHVPELPDHGLASADARRRRRRGRLRRDRDRALRHRLRRARRASASSSSTSATPRARTAARTAACGSSERGRPSGWWASAPGAPTSPATSTSSPGWPGSATRRGAPRGRGRAVPGGTATTRFEELLEDPEVEAVVVATPVVTHAELARRALLAGKHVFVEKPMALGAEDAEELVALAEERGLVLMPGPSAPLPPRRARS